MKTLSITFYCLLLIGCSPSVEDLVEDDAKRSEILAECEASAKEGEWNDTCKVLEEAIDIVFTNQYNDCVKDIKDELVSHQREVSSASTEAAKKYAEKNCSHFSTTSHLKNRLFLRNMRFAIDE